MKSENQYTKYHIPYTGFTLVELLVVISIIGILIGLSIFGLQGARESSRDAKRKSDLEQIRSGVEIYKSDCNIYPTSLQVASKGTSLVGDDSLNLNSCLSTNTYIAEVPVDPTTPNRDFTYSSDGVTYEICASLEQGGDPVTCGGSTSCGSEACNYKVTNP